MASEAPAQEAGGSSSSNGSGSGTTPSKSKRKQRYDAVDAGMTKFVKDYPVDDLGKMATLNYFLAHHFDWNFIGFYMVSPSGDTLTIGPYQGDVLASGIISFGKGVCGTAAATNTTQIVKNVKECDNYIACDLVTQSEIVVPVNKAGKLIAVLDIDSEQLGGFNKVDQARLERLVDFVVNDTPLE